MQTKQVNQVNPVLIQLSAKDVEFAREIGRLRYSEAIEKERENKYGGNKRTPAQNLNDHILGAVGELASLKGLGLPGCLTMNAFSDPDLAFETDNGDYIEVDAKTTSYFAPASRLHMFVGIHNLRGSEVPAVNPDWIYLFARALPGLQRVELIGTIWGSAIVHAVRTGQISKYINRQGRPSFRVPAAMFQPIKVTDEERESLQKSNEWVLNPEIRYSWNRTLSEDFKVFSTPDLTCYVDYATLLHDADRKNSSETDSERRIDPPE
jgi:hypothetical protein